MKISIILLAIMFQFHVNGQGHLASGELPRVEQDNFYRINIGPDLSAFLEKDFSNLRIMDEKGMQVPYLLETEDDVVKSEFAEYAFERHVIDGCCTRIIVRNEAKNSLNNLNLRVMNADVVKHAKLLGSDDGKTWYALRERFTLQGARDVNETSQVKTVEFPLSDYALFRLEIDDSTTAPLNVATVGYYKRYQKSAVLDKLENFTLHRSDSVSTKKTYLRVGFDRAQWLDEVRISARSDMFFYREVSLAVMHRAHGRNGDHLTLKPLASALLTHENPTSLSFDAMKTHEICFVVENADNIPLKDIKVEVFQRKRSAIAWLSAKSNYKVIAGDSTFVLPSYDVIHFRNRIPTQLTSLSIGQVTERLHDRSSDEVSIFNRYWMWTGLAVIIAMLGFLSIRVIKEMNATRKA
jgi:hypothetical protein